MRLSSSIVYSLYVYHSDMVKTISIVVLGAPNVGKSCLVEQFVNCDYKDKYLATQEPAIYRPGVIFNDRVFEVSITDVPAKFRLPTIGVYEWLNFKDYLFTSGVKTAHAFVLVYDVDNKSSFSYLKELREHLVDMKILENGHDIPVLVVGNKRDLEQSTAGENFRREVAQLVRKGWKCSYMECSAKFNWHIVALFNELIKSVIGGRERPSATRIANNLRKRNCVIL